MKNLICLSRHLLGKLSSHLNFGHEVKIDFEDLKKEVDKEIPISKESFYELNIEEAKNIGFSLWSDEQPNLYLIPGYLYKFLPEGMELISISGEKKIVGKDYIDNDTRFGCLAFGIELKGAN